jgi:hypothetical protein
MTNFSPKRSIEKEVFTTDLTPLLSPGVTIESAVWEVRVVDGVDPSPSDMLIGGTSISGNKVSQMIGGGVAGVTYAPVCIAQTSDNQTLIWPEAGDGHLYVSE